MDIVLIPKKPDLFVKLNDEGIVFTNGRSEFVYKYENIKHIFQWRDKNVLVVINNGGKITAGFFTSFGDKTFKNLSEKFNFIINSWHSVLSDKPMINQFEYNEIIIKMDKNWLIRSICYCILPVTLCSYVFIKDLLGNSLGLSLTQRCFTVIVSFLAAVGFGYFMYYCWNEYKYKKFFKIEICDDALKICNHSRFAKIFLSFIKI